MLIFGQTLFNGGSYAKENFSIFDMLPVALRR